MPDFLPPLFLKRIASLLPENELEAFEKSYDRDFQPSLRVNTLKNSVQEFWEIFSEQKRTPVAWCNEGFYIERKGPFTKSPYYHSGLFYIQEASSMLPVEVLNPMPGDYVLDTCASPGSKTTQISAKMKNRGLLVANEIRRDRIGRLLENVIRFGAKNTIVCNQASSAFNPMKEFFDKILVDAPCSGEGMFKKDPDALKHWSLANIRTCSTAQKQILRDVIPALKTGGTLVYSTCTMAPEENEETLDWILKTYPGCFKMEEIPFGFPGITSFEEKEYSKEVSFGRRMWPHKIESEGFFIAKLTKIKPIETLHQTNKAFQANKNFLQPAPQKIISDFFKSIGLKTPQDAFKIGYKIYSWGPIDKNEITPYLNYMKPVYMGTHVGDEKKNRMEPAHAFALSLAKQEIEKMPHADLDLENAVKYLRGEEISGLDLGDGGFKLVCYDKYPIGWANYKGGKLKNFFPHSLRGKI